MPRPPSDRVDEAFEIWSTEAERNDTRTAELMGVPQSTVSYWHRTYGWDERYLALIQRDGDVMARVGLAAMRAGMPIVTQRLLHIATAKKAVYDADGKQIGETYAAQDRDAIQAAKLLAQYGLTDHPTDGWSSALEAQVQIPLSEEPDLAVLSTGEESLAELKARASRMIEATVQAVNTRPVRGRKRV
jgi:hypothetical protein